ncbi:hypothetical protein F5Y04DRAFT_280051 [Hypomontagnella monticulosa]|nr:hypothetical protein F5Y04DRAFT_280051 [Hypomontagnella monticulosa]
MSSRRPSKKNTATPRGSHGEHSLLSKLPVPPSTGLWSSSQQPPSPVQHDVSSSPPVVSTPVKRRRTSSTTSKPNTPPVKMPKKSSTPPKHYTHTLPVKMPKNSPIPPPHYTLPVKMPKKSSTPPKLYSGLTLSPKPAPKPSQQPEKLPASPHLPLPLNLVQSPHPFRNPPPPLAFTPVKGTPTKRPRENVSLPADPSSPLDPAPPAVAPKGPGTHLPRQSGRDIGSEGFPSSPLPLPSGSPPRSGGSGGNGGSNNGNDGGGSSSSSSPPPPPSSPPTPPPLSPPRGPRRRLVDRPPDLQREEVRSIKHIIQAMIHWTSELGQGTPCFPMMEREEDVPKVLNQYGAHWNYDRGAPAAYWSEKIYDVPSTDKGLLENPKIVLPPDIVHDMLKPWQSVLSPDVRKSSPRYRFIGFIHKHTQHRPQAAKSPSSEDQKRVYTLSVWDREYDTLTWHDTFHYQREKRPDQIRRFWRRAVIPRGIFGDIPEGQRKEFVGNIRCKVDYRTSEIMDHTSRDRLKVRTSLWSVMASAIWYMDNDNMSSLDREIEKEWRLNPSKKRKRDDDDDENEDRSGPSVDFVPDDLETFGGISLQLFPSFVAFLMVCCIRRQPKRTKQQHINFLHSLKFDARHSDKAEPRFLEFVREGLEFFATYVQAEIMSAEDRVINAAAEAAVAIASEFVRQSGVQHNDRIDISQEGIVRDHAEQAATDAAEQILRHRYQFWNDQVEAAMDAIPHAVGTAALLACTNADREGTATDIVINGTRETVSQAILQAIKRDNPNAADRWVGHWTRWIHNELEVRKK